MTVPNWITCGRLVVAILGVVIYGATSTSALAFLLFAVAIALDKVDGVVARRTGCCTWLGKYLDTVVDKIVITIYFVCLVELGVLPALGVAAAVVRDLLVQAFRSYATACRVVIPTYPLSNARYAVQVASICAGLLSAAEFGAVPLPAAWTWLSRSMFACGLLLGYMSLFVIVKKHWRVVVSEAAEPLRE